MTAKPLSVFNFSMSGYLHLLKYIRKADFPLKQEKDTRSLHLSSETQRVSIPYILPPFPLSRSSFSSSDRLWEVESGCEMDTKGFFASCFF